MTRFRLRRHRLLARASGADAATVVGDMGGAQAQLLAAAGVSLWARIEGLRSSQIRAALFAERSLVKMWCMRRTLYLVPARDAAVFGRGTVRRVLREVRWARNRGVAADALTRAMDATLAALDAPATRGEIAEAVSAELKVPLRQRVGGGGWGHAAKTAWIRVGRLSLPVGYLLHLAAVRGTYCHGPPRGNEPTFVRADAWVHGLREVGVEEAEAELLRRYLTAFGPASPADFAWWTGCLRSEAQRTWDRLGAEIAPVSLDRTPTGVLARDLPDLTAKDEGEEPPLRLLPYFDSYLLGHAGRDHLVAPAYRDEVYRPQGWVAPVVLIHGRVAGVWGQELKNGSLTVTVRPLGPSLRGALDAITSEAEDLAGFLGAETAAVRFDRGDAIRPRALAPPPVRSVSGRRAA